MYKPITSFLLAVAALAGCTHETRISGPAALYSDVGAARSRCPSNGTPSPGSRVAGGLEVDGVCTLDTVTVTGGVTIDSGGHLELEGSTIYGGVSVARCGEFDVDLAPDLGIATGAISTINGDIVILASPACAPPAFSDVDIWTAQINGRISVSGEYAGGPTICGNEITGDVIMSGVSTPHFRFWVGDPEGPLGCPGNTIRGTLSVVNSSRLEVESNSLGGSVLLDGSAVELNGNTIGGSLRCTNGAVIVPGQDYDPSGNTVRGANSCYLP